MSRAPGMCSVRTAFLASTFCLDPEMVAKRRRWRPWGARPSFPWWTLDDAAVESFPWRTSVRVNDDGVSVTEHAVSIGELSAYPEMARR